MIQRIVRLCVLILIAGIGTSLAEDTPQPPLSITCKGYARVFTCEAKGIEGYKLLPEWIWHANGKVYRTYGDHFHYMATKEPVLLEMRVYLDDQSEAPYDSVIYRRALVWVRLCGNKAMFGRYVEGVDPPECQHEGRS